MSLNGRNKNNDSGYRRIQEMGRDFSKLNGPKEVAEEEVKVIIDYPMLLVQLKLNIHSQYITNDKNGGRAMEVTGLGKLR